MYRHSVLSDLRLKFLTFLMVVVLAISITILVLRFGTSVLEDNFVAQLSTHYQNSVEFMAFYGLLNFYLYTMAFVYSPSKNAVFGKCQVYTGPVKCCVQSRLSTIILKG